MTSVKTNHYFINFSSVGILLLIALMLPSCARKISFQTSSVVPSAEGSVKMKKDKNKNYDIDLSVIRLADPKRLNPSKQVYVVWINTDQNGTKNIGQLKTSSSILSKTLKSSLKTVSSVKPTRIFITAGDDAAVQYPSGEVVLDTSSF
ncbi:MAG: hypothetical protein M3Z92_13660 [Bacteroidota bacterium]|nr:hypothetical protein [Bacteroidota bacterium]